MKKYIHKLIFIAFIFLPIFILGCGSAPFGSESRSKAIASSTNGEAVLMQGHARLYRDAVKISTPNSFDDGISSDMVLTENGILFMRWFSDTQQYVVIEKIEYNKISMLRRDEYSLLIGQRTSPYIIVGTNESRFYSFTPFIQKSTFDDFFNFVKSKLSTKISG